MRSQAARLLADEVAWISADQMREVDRIMIEDVGIELIQMMENAGRNLARLVLDLYDPTTATVLCGTGGNGGGGLVAARHLANAGVDVTVVLTKTPHGVPGHQLDIVQRMGLAIVDRPSSADVAIDSLIGYSLRGAPRGRATGLIESMAKIAPAIVSLDTPSGLDVTSGEVPGAFVSASATMTLALPKVGLRRSEHVGDLYLADISVPALVYERMGIGPTPDFRPGPVRQIIM